MKQEKPWVLISKWALWICGLLTFAAGMSTGFLIAVLVLR